MKYPYPLGRNVNPFDYRDFNLRQWAFREKTTVTESDWKFPASSLDQLETPHCVGFAIAGFRINLPTFTPQTNDDGHKYYYKCKEYDGQPLMENGSCSRSAAKTMVFYGMINAYAFATDMETLKWWLLNRGPLIVGTSWTMDMFTPDKDNIIHYTGVEVGGHEYILNAYKPNLYRIHNSWNDAWGINGEAWIPEDELTALFNHSGDALTAVELDPTIPIPDPKNPGCLSKVAGLFK